MNDNKQSNQSRFLIAAVLSMAVLLGWSYFFAPAPKENANTNANISSNTTNTNAAPQVEATPQPTEPNQPIASTPDNTPNKVLTIKTPLYQVTMDSKGALATSWILIKNVSSHGEKELWAEGSNKEVKIPLELIPQDNPSREFPFRLDAGEQNLNTLLNERNYSVSEEGEITLNGNETKQIDFVLQDGDVEVRKTFVFHADSFLTDLQLKATRAGQIIPNTKLMIGSAIGDQGIKIHNYYHIESEGVGYVDSATDRHFANSLVKKDENDSSKNKELSRTQVAGQIDWAGVGDTYFGMAAFPAQPTTGLEYEARFKTVPTDPHYDGIISWISGSKKTSVDRHLVTALVPVIADGSTTKIYTGTKDYFTLRDYETKLSEQLGRTANIGDFINYSNYSFFRWIQRPIAQFLLICLTGIYSVVGNFGIAIIIFTLIFYSVFFPLRWYSSKSFKKAQSNAPKMKELQDKMKAMQAKGIAMDDPKMRELQMEQLKMTKDAIPIGGCLPLLLQMPLFVAFYTAVTIGLDFRQASFLWLNDLSAADPFHILEFLFAASMAGTMIFTPTTPAVTDEQKCSRK